MSASATPASPQDPSTLLRAVYRVFAARYLAAQASLAYYPGRWLALHAADAVRPNAVAVLDEEPLAALAAGLVDDALADSAAEPAAAGGEPDFERAFERFRERAHALAAPGERLVFVRIGRHSLAPSEAAQRRARAAGDPAPATRELLSVMLEVSGFDTGVAGGVVLAADGLPQEVMPAMPIPAGPRSG